MNGRTNKVADTCYAWWVGASIDLLSQTPSDHLSSAPLPLKHKHLFDVPALETYLLLKTQHPALGGFGKFPGDLPDLYHSYMGLAALGLIGVDGVKEVDAGMCISTQARQRIAGLWKVE
jgi:geranylgeranyl transferase type-1 subunit beta